MPVLYEQAGGPALDFDAAFADILGRMGDLSIVRDVRMERNKLRKQRVEALDKWNKKEAKEAKKQGREPVLLNPALHERAEHHPGPKFAGKQRMLMDRIRKTVARRNRDKAYGGPTSSAIPKYGTRKYKKGKTRRVVRAPVVVTVSSTSKDVHDLLTHAFVHREEKEIHDSPEIVRQHLVKGFGLHTEEATRLVEEAIRNTNYPLTDRQTDLHRAKPPKIGLHLLHDTPTFYSVPSPSSPIFINMNLTCVMNCAAAVIVARPEDAAVFARAASTDLEDEGIHWAEVLVTKGSEEHERRRRRAFAVMSEIILERQGVRLPVNSAGREARKKIRSCTSQLHAIATRMLQNAKVLRNTAGSMLEEARQNLTDGQAPVPATIHRLLHLALPTGKSLESQLSKRSWHKFKAKATSMLFSHPSRLAETQKKGVTRAHQYVAAHVTTVVPALEDALKDMASVLRGASPVEIAVQTMSVEELQSVAETFRDSLAKEHWAANVKVVKDKERVWREKRKGAAAATLQTDLQELWDNRTTLFDQKLAGSFAVMVNKMRTKTGLFDFVANLKHQLASYKQTHRNSCATLGSMHAVERGFRSRPRGAKSSKSKGAGGAKSAKGSKSALGHAKWHTEYVGNDGAPFILLSPLEPRKRGSHLNCDELATGNPGERRWGHCHLTYRASRHAAAGDYADTSCGSVDVDTPDSGSWDPNSPRRRQEEEDAWDAAVSGVCDSPQCQRDETTDPGEQTTCKSTLADIKRILPVALVPCPDEYLERTFFNFWYNKYTDSHGTRAVAYLRRTVRQHLIKARNLEMQTTGVRQALEKAERELHKLEQALSNKTTKPTKKEGRQKKDLECAVRNVTNELSTLHATLEKEKVDFVAQLPILKQVEDNARYIVHGLDRVGFVDKGTIHQERWARAHLNQFHLVSDAVHLRQTAP